MAKYLLCFDDSSDMEVECPSDKAAMRLARRYMMSRGDDEIAMEVDVMRLDGSDECVGTIVMQMAAA